MNQFEHFWIFEIDQIVLDHDSEMNSADSAFSEKIIWGFECMQIFLQRGEPVTREVGSWKEEWGKRKLQKAEIFYYGGYFHGEDRDLAE